ncbi:MAG: DNA polymerase III subunit beta [Planctomycetes bacterium]|jgi:DNA polymerase-3 subunit beta|nr:DNA polymerase III subunit beta [Planctomycetota bacterium]
MKIIGLQENLKQALSIVGCATSKNINLPILGNILIRAKDNIELITTDLEIGITHQLRGKIEKSGEITIDAKVFGEYVSLLPNQKIEIITEEEGEEVEVNCENYKTRIKGQSAKEFPLIPSIKKENQFKVKRNDFKEALSKVVFAVSNNESRLELSGVLFTFIDNQLVLAATDSFRLSEKKIACQIENQNQEERIIVPVKTIQELIKILNNSIELTEDSQEVLIYISDNQILFCLNSTELISRIISGQYPDYKQIIPEKNKSRIILSRAELLRAVKASAIFSKTGINDVGLSCSKDRVLISAASGQVGESSVELEAKVIGDDNDITINYRYLLDGLNSIEGDKVVLEVIDANAPCVFKPEKDESQLYIVMPLRQ